MRSVASIILFCGASALGLLLLKHSFIGLIWSAALLLAFFAVAYPGKYLRLSALGLACLLLPFALAESFLHIQNKLFSVERFGDESGDHYDGYYQVPHALGYQPYPDRIVNARAFTPEGESIYDVHYTINAEGYREVSANEARSGSDKPAALFFGGSFIFGEGLEDADTIPVQFVRLSENRWRAFNLGLHGYGPHQMLRSLELDLPGELDPGTVGGAIYLLLSGHLERISGESSWDPHGPRYDRDARGNAAYRGTFVGGEYSLRRILFSSKLLRKFNALLGASEEEKQGLALAILSDSDRILKERYGVGLTVVVWAEDVDRLEFLIEELGERGFSVLDSRNILSDVPGAERTIPKDGHPSARSARAIAEALARYFSRANG